MKNYQNIFLVTLVTFVTFLSWSNSYAQQHSTGEFINLPELESADIGIQLVETKTGKVLTSHNNNKLLTPASILKVLTTATALEIYGPDHRIPTLLEYVGNIEPDGTLKGDIYIKGNGDPTLGSEHIDTEKEQKEKEDFLKNCMTAIRKAGIKKVEGKVIADESCFDQEGISPKWLWEDMGNYFASGSYGISYKDNMYRLYLKSGVVGSKPEIIRTQPSMPQINFLNNLQVKKSNSDNAYIYGVPFTGERWLFGAVPANQTAFCIRGDIPDPPLYLATCLKNELEKNNIPVTGEPSTYRLCMLKNELLKKDRKILYTHESVPLSEIIRITNVKSNNHYAEHLLKLVALSKYPQASFQKGIETVQSFWKEKGINLSGIQIYDGSGLSPVNKVTPAVMVELLIYMYNKSEYSSAFYSSLPEAGKEGTVRNLLKKTALEGKVHLKSGSITNVQCYTGYVIKDNKEYAFCIMVNNFGKQRRKVISEIEKMMLGW
ncbi:MAG: D-alanyl-D-alanine carboxypeptidase/D-alanyl-D-alanine-endopeptidase [Candidatus Azobacteroides sp.]|nr:D-alanyl-D-alanine carboxypeptidase/D-alanyl-D-alanine-endopeptidase [Candidatus Azobacteroides sp.]